MASEDPTEHLQALCTIHERNLRILVNKVAHFGLSAPVHLVTELERETRLLVSSARAAGRNLETLVATARALLASSGITEASETTSPRPSPANRDAARQPDPKRDFDAFICYSELDLEAVTALKTELETHSLRIWIDFEQILPGQTITERIELGLRSSAKVLACLSHNAKNSSWLQAEYGAILKTEIESSSGRLIPVLVGEIEDGDIPLLLGNLRRIDVRQAHGLAELVRHLRNSG